MTVASKVRYLLEQRHWSHAMLALRTGMSRRYISVILADDKDSVSLRYAKALARAFGVSLDYLADMPAHEVDQMPADEQELISSYRAITNPNNRRMALLSVKIHVEVELANKPKEIDESNEG